MTAGFAVWITGRPASGKSTIAAALATALTTRGVDLEVVESDALRRVLTPRPTYTDEEREIFYAAMATIGALLAKHGVAVILDATAHRRGWRDRARHQIPRFAEVYVDCAEAVCRARDPKGIYRKAREGLATTVPGVQVPYEAPAHAEVVVSGDRERPDAAAQRILEHLIEQGWVQG
jgi:adenylylsulfate kinase